MSPSSLFLKAGASALLTASILPVVSSTVQVYSLTETYEGDNFFDGFDFLTGAFPGETDGSDPTHGFVDYLSYDAANAAGLLDVNDDPLDTYVRWDVDTTSYLSTSDQGRASVRLESKRTYTKGLFVADIAHMPVAACGTWPAFWTVGLGNRVNTWPSWGEVDIIEGYNLATTNRQSAHTSGAVNGKTCLLAAADQSSAVSFGQAQCDVSVNYNQGCYDQGNDPSDYGAAFNGGAFGNVGGTFAMEWTDEYIKIWNWALGSVPLDVAAGAPVPSAAWGTPTFNLGTSCDIDTFFQQHNIVFDTTFCGDAAGNQQVWESSGCYSSQYPTCDSYVADNPQAYDDSYWKVRSVKVYTLGPPVLTTTTTTTSSTTSTTTTTTKPTTTTTTTTTAPMTTTTTTTPPTTTTTISVPTTQPTTATTTSTQPTTTTTTTSVEPTTTSTTVSSVDSSTTSAATSTTQSETSTLVSSTGSTTSSASTFESTPASSTSDTQTTGTTATSTTPEGTSSSTSEISSSTSATSSTSLDSSSSTTDVSSSSTGVSTSASTTSVTTSASSMTISSLSSSSGSYITVCDSTTLSSSSSTTSAASSTTSASSGIVTSSTSNGGIFVSSSAASSDLGSTTSTVITTQIITISSCAPTVTNCPYTTAPVTTSTVLTYTTVCPITGTSPTQTSALAPTQFTTSTVYTTQIVTITKCPATVTNCPLSSTQVITSTYALYTTVCPVTGTTPSPAVITSPQAASSSVVKIVTLPVTVSPVPAPAPVISSPPYALNGTASAGSASTGLAKPSGVTVITSPVVVIPSGTKTASPAVVTGGAGKVHIGAFGIGALALALTGALL